MCVMCVSKVRRKKTSTTSIIMTIICCSFFFSSFHLCRKRSEKRNHYSSYRSYYGSCTTTKWISRFNKLSANEEWNLSHEIHFFSEFHKIFGCNNMVEASTMTMKRIIWRTLAEHPYHQALIVLPFVLCFTLHKKFRLLLYHRRHRLTLSQHKILPATQIVSLFLNWTEMLWIIQRTKANARSFQLPFVSFNLLSTDAGEKFHFISVFFFSVCITVPN